MPIENSKYILLLMTASFEKPENISALLENAGFRLLQAQNCKEAVEIAGATPPDLILLDIDKYTRQDVSVIRYLKNNEATCPVPLLFVTSMANGEYIQDCLSYDNVDFIIKPFCSEELVIRIHHQLLLLRAERTIRRQNDKLKKTVEAQNKLYSVIAHDLRAPIGTIKMINSSIEAQKAKIKDTGIQRLFEMINETTEEAFNLLENLLRWTRNQNGKTKVYASDFNISRAIRQVISLFSTISEAKEINIHNHVNESYYVYADEDMIKTVLRNLISNAVKFTYPGGSIDIGLTEREDMTEVSVKDNGKGIPRALQTKLLKSNEYITTYGTRNEKGSGLGLILCRDFIKMNKGKFWFTSQEGIGTTFFFTLPQADPDNQISMQSR